MATISRLDNLPPRSGGDNYFAIHEPKQQAVAAAPFRDRAVRHAIVRVIEPIFERRLPLGNFASQFFANVYLNPLDQFVKRGLRVKV